MNSILCLFVLYYTIVNSEHVDSIQNNKSHEIVHSRISKKNAFSCGTNDTTWCIDSRYKKDDEPWRNFYSINASFPWIYNFDFRILEVQEVNDLKQNIKLSMFFLVEWLEPRIHLNESSREWNDTKFGLPDTVVIPTEALQYLWKPDLHISGMESFETEKILKDTSTIIVHKNHTLSYETVAEITFSCLMNFTKYPLDDHKCPFRIGSYQNQIMTVNCTDHYYYRTRYQRILDYSIEIDSLSDDDRIDITPSNGRYAMCGFNILLRRKRRQTFFQVYFTTILFVAVSWVSFIINPDIVPGRMGLLVTIFLVLTNIFIGVNSTAPSSDDLNAIDCYLLVCIILVFLALIEYAIVLLWSRLKEEKIVFFRTGKKENVSSIYNQNTKKVVGMIEKHSNILHLDWISLILFPIIFLVFNVIYFIIH